MKYYKDGLHIKIERIGAINVRSKSLKKYQFISYQQPFPIRTFTTYHITTKKII